MVFRKVTSEFCHQRIKKRTGKWIINELPKTWNDKVYPQIPFKTRSKRYNIKSSIDNTPSGQLYNLTFNVTDLFRDERIRLNYNKAAEIRPRVELLIVEAMRHGDKHKPTMELAKYWIRESALIHKLFKVFVPRYSNYPSAFTAIHMLGLDYSILGQTLTELAKYRQCFYQRGEAILEMRGNSLPPIIRPKLDRSGLLTNVLIDGARFKSA